MATSGDLNMAIDSPTWQSARVPDVGWFPSDQELSATAEDIGRELHDAWLDLLTVTHAGDSVTIEGYRERPAPGGWFRVGRYPVVLTVTGAARIDSHDPDGLGGIAVCDVTTESGSMTLTSGFVGHLAVIGEHLAAAITLSGTPSAERRRFSRRWVPRVAE